MMQCDKLQKRKKNATIRLEYAAFYLLRSMQKYHSLMS